MVDYSGGGVCAQKGLVYWMVERQQTLLARSHSRSTALSG